MKKAGASGRIAIAVPGLKREFPGGVVPEELRPYRTSDMHFFTTQRWRELWEKEKGLRIETCREMDCCALAWKEWLASPNPYAQSDVAMMEAEGGRYCNLVQITGCKL